MDWLFVSSAVRSCAAALDALWLDRNAASPQFAT